MVNLQGLSQILQNLGTIYYYPARFHAGLVVSLVSKYCDGKVFFDPFAGSGSGLLAASLLGFRESYGLDLLPMIDIFVEYAYEILNQGSRALADTTRNIKNALNSSEIFKCCTEEELFYWYPSRVVPVLEKIWGTFHENVAFFDKNDLTWRPYKENIPWATFAILSLRITRKLSFTDDSVAKYYRSNVKRTKLRKLLRKNRNVEKIILLELENTMQKLLSLPKINIPKPQTHGFFDISEMEIPVSNVDCIVTSPPYLIAHEYVRSFKLDLKWLGVPMDKIMWLRKHEIPYKPVAYKVNSGLYEYYKEKIRESEKEHLIKYYENYFGSITKALDNIIENLASSSTLVLVLADTTLAGYKIPIGKILAEHLLANHNKLRLTEEFGDVIKKRKLFKKRNNTNPNGVTQENIYIYKWG